MMRMKPNRAVGTAVAILLLGCDGKKEPSRASPAPLPIHPRSQSTSAADTTRDLPPSARVALDSGNSLFRTKRYAEALAQYRLTARRAPGDPTAYIGMYMVAEATKNRALADSTMAVLGAMGVMAPSGPHVTSKSAPNKPPKN